MMINMGHNKCPVDKENRKLPRRIQEKGMTPDEALVHRKTVYGISYGEAIPMDEVEILNRQKRSQKFLAKLVRKGDIGTLRKLRQMVKEKNEY
jgi:hypothetical protein